MGKESSWSRSGGRGGGGLNLNNTALSVLDPADNMKDLLNEITNKEDMAANKRMGYVNNFTKV